MRALSVWVPRLSSALCLCVRLCAAVTMQAHALLLHLLLSFFFPGVMTPPLVVLMDRLRLKTDSRTPRSGEVEHAHTRLWAWADTPPPHERVFIQTTASNFSISTPRLPFFRCQNGSLCASRVCAYWTSREKLSESRAD